MKRYEEYLRSCDEDYKKQWEKARKRYQEEANKMSEKELRKSYVQLKLGKTSIFTFRLSREEYEGFEGVNEVE